MKISPFLSSLVSILIVSHSVSAETLAWWRFEDNFTAENSQTDLELLPQQSNTFSEDVPGPSIVGEGNIQSNSFSFSNGNGKGAICELSDLVESKIKQTSFTIEAFIKLDNSSEGGFSNTFNRIIGNSTNEELGGWALQVHQEKLRFMAYATSSGKLVQLTSQQTLSRGEWHHVAVVGLRDGKFLDFQLYIDGEAQPEIVGFEGTSEEAIQSVKQSYIIGGYNPFSGLIDEIRISDEALSPSEFLIAR